MAIKVVIVLEKFRKKKSIQDVNFLAIWGFQIEGNGMFSRASPRNPPGLHPGTHLRKQRSLRSLPALPFSIKNRPPPLKILVTPLIIIRFSEAETRKNKNKIKRTAWYGDCFENETTKVMKQVIYLQKWNKRSVLRQAVFRYKSKYKKVGALPIRIVTKV